MYKHLICCLALTISLQAGCESFNLVTMPKSGTFFMMRFLEDITGIPHSFHGRTFSEDGHHFCVNHIDEPRPSSGKLIFTIRDPRDGLLSFVNYILSEYRKSGRRFPFLRNDCDDFLHVWTHEERLLYLLNRAPNNLYSANLKLLNQTFQDLQNRDDVLMLRFEEITGPRGGGSFESQLNAFQRLKDFIHLDISLGRMLDYAHGRWGHRDTFFKGQIGLWKENFSDAVIEAFKQNPIYSTALVELGYVESQDDW